ncbi:MAG: hypothetical protein WBQ86_08500 [Candidatus Binatus sp.]
MRREDIGRRYGARHEKIELDKVFQTRTRSLESKFDIAKYLLKLSGVISADKLAFRV